MGGASSKPPTKSEPQTQSPTSPLSDKTENKIVNVEKIENPVDQKGSQFNQHENPCEPGTYDEHGNLIAAYDESGNPIYQTTDEDGNSLYHRAQYDESGNIIYQRVTYDEAGTPTYHALDDAAVDTSKSNTNPVADTAAAVNTANSAINPPATEVGKTDDFNFDALADAMMQNLLGVEMNDQLPEIPEDLPQIRHADSFNEEKNAEGEETQGGEDEADVAAEGEEKAEYVPEGGEETYERETEGLEATCEANSDEIEAAWAARAAEKLAELEQDVWAAWREFATIANLDLDNIQLLATTALSVLDQVSNGDFRKKLLYQLPWSYRFHQLKDAVRQCYLESGSYYDSSKYDACNDVPRYEAEGMVEWWTDLCTQWEAVKAMVSDMEAGKTSFASDLDALEALSDSKTEEELVSALEQRIHTVEEELTNLRSRCLAMVSVEGGPSRESIEVVYRYLQENVHADTDLNDIKDELEEFVSSELESRHRFLLDVMIKMAIFEDEYTVLERRLQTERRIRDGGQCGPETDVDETELDATEPESKDATADEVEEVEEADENTGSTIRALIEEQEAKEVQLLAEIEAQKAAQSSALIAKIRLKKRFAKGPLEQTYLKKLLQSKAIEITAVSQFGRKVNADVSQMDENTCVRELKATVKDMDDLAAHYEESQRAFEKAKAMAEEKESEEDADSNVERKRMLADQERMARQLFEDSMVQRQRRADALRNRLAKLREARVLTSTDTDAVAETDEGETPEGNETGVSNQEADDGIKGDLDLMTDEEVEREYQKLLDVIEMDVRLDEAGALVPKLPYSEETKQSADGDGVSVGLIAEESMSRLRLEEDLLAKRLERANALKDTLSRRRGRRTGVADAEAKGDDTQSKAGSRRASAAEVLAELEGIQSDGTVPLDQAAIENAFVDHEEEEEIKAELLQIEQAALAAKEAHRLQMLAAIREQNERESARLEEELLAQKESKMRALKDRLNERNKSRARELVAETGCSEEKALVLAEEEAQEEELQETVSIELEVVKTLESKHATAMVDIKEAHERELAKMESDLQAQREMKTKAMHDKLAKRKGKRAMQLLETGVSASEAFDIAEVEAIAESEKEKVRLDEEIDAEIQKQKAEILKPLKELQAREAQRLDDELAAQETKKRRALQEKLAKKRAEKEAKLEEEHMSKAQAEKEAQRVREEEKAEEEKLETELIEMKRIHEEVHTRLAEDLSVKKKGASSALQDRLNKKKAKKEVEKTPEQKQEEYLSNLREKHKQAVHKLTSFVEHEKKFSLYECEHGIRGGASGGDDVDEEESDMSASLAHISMNYANTKEGLVAGFKLRCVYEIRTLKDSGQWVPLSDSNMIKVEDAAASSLFKRVFRDMRTLLEKRRGERVKTLEKLKAEKANRMKIEDSLTKFDQRSLDITKREMHKILTTLAGLCFDFEIFVAEDEDEAPNTSKKPLLQSMRSMKSKFQKGEDDLFSDIDDADALAVNKYPLSARAWLRGMFGLHSAYMKCFHAIQSRVNHIFNKMESTLTDESMRSNAGWFCESAGALKLRCLAEAVFNQLRNSNIVKTFANADENTIQPSIHNVSEAMLRENILVSTLQEKSPPEIVVKIVSEEWKKFVQMPWTVVVDESIVTAVAIKPKGAKDFKKSKEEAAEEDRKLKAKERDVLSSLQTKMNIQRKELEESLKKKRGVDCSDGAAESAEENKLLSTAFEDVKQMLLDRPELLQEDISANVLMEVVKRKALGEEVSVSGIKEIQVEVAKAEQRLEVQKLLDQQREEQANLDVSLKVKQAREQQALQKRLLQRKAAKKQADVSSANAE